MSKDEDIRLALEKQRAELASRMEADAEAHRQKGDAAFERGETGLFIAESTRCAALSGAAHTIRCYR